MVLSWFSTGLANMTRFFKYLGLFFNTIIIEPHKHKAFYLVAVTVSTPSPSGIPDNEYTEYFSRRTFTGAVAPHPFSLNS